MAEIKASGFPRMSLGEAVSRVSKVYAAEHLNPTDQKVVAQHMGYASISGTSLSTLASLRKFGLLEGRGEQLRVTKDAQILILDPPDSLAYRKVAEKCLFMPPVFQELRKHFESVPSEKNLTTFLEKQGFRQNAAKRAAKSYISSVSFAGVNLSGNQAEEEYRQVENDVDEVPHDLQAAGEPPRPQYSQGISVDHALISDSLRTVGSYEFEDGSFVRIVVSGDIDTSEALDTVETLIELKRLELKRISK